MEHASSAMATWIGTLARSGIVRGSDAQAGEAVAAFVVGAARIEELRAWLATQDEATVQRESVAAIEVCIWMASVDREVVDTERSLLREIVQASGLPEDARDALLRATEDLPSLRSLQKRLTHPVLRELLLALAWELACADGRIVRAESDFYEGLALKLEVDPERAREIREAVSSRV